MTRSASLVAGAALVVGLALAAAGCGGDASAPQADPAAGAPAPVTSRTDPAALPEGHPPIASEDPSIALPPPGAGTGDAAIEWEVPAGWVDEPPTSRMRRAQYRVPGKAGDGECVVFYFGPGQGGDPMSNARRWAGQFTRPDGKPASEELEVSEIDVNGIPVTLVETSGTYQNVMVSSETFPDYALLGAIIDGPDARWFFKLTGPEATVEAQRDAFMAMTRSVTAGS